MLLSISRKLSQSESIKHFITNIKSILNQNSIDGLINSYSSTKLEQQRTFHLKLLTLKSHNKTFIIRDVHNTNKNFSFMISDLISNFPRFTITEINDFLSIYRKTLLSGTNFLNPSQYEHLKETLKTFKHNSTHQFPIRASTLYNFAFLDIKNENLFKDIRNYSMTNIKGSDMLQILQGMNFNSSYFNDELFHMIPKKFHMIFGRFESIKTLLLCLDEYLMACELNNIPVSPTVQSILKLHLDRHICFNRNIVIKLFLKRYKRLEKFQSTFRTELRKMVNYSFSDVDKYLEFVTVFCKEFPEETLVRKQLFANLKKRMTEEQPVMHPWRVKLIKTLADFEYGDEELIDLCLKNLSITPKNSIYIALAALYYPQLTQKPLQSNPFHTGPLNLPEIVNNIDTIELIGLLTNLDRHKAFTAKPLSIETTNLIQICEDSIITKTTQDPVLQDIISRFLACRNLHHPSHLYTTLLKKIKTAHNPPFT